MGCQKQPPQPPEGTTTMFPHCFSEYSLLKSSLGVGRGCIVAELPEGAGFGAWVGVQQPLAVSVDLLSFFPSEVLKIHWLAAQMSLLVYVF